MAIQLHFLKPRIPHNTYPSLLPIQIHAETLMTLRIWPYLILYSDFYEYYQVSCTFAGLQRQRNLQNVQKAAPPTESLSRK